MEQENLKQSEIVVKEISLNEPKLHSLAAIDIASYLGSPLAATWLMRQNFRALGQPEEGTKALITGIISTILILAIAINLPEELLDKIPNMLIPLVYTIIIHFWAKKVQGDALDNHTLFYSRWRAAGVGIVACVIIVVVMIIVMLSLDAIGIIDLDAM